VLDQLRGALPYHKAIRGTLITLGSFSKGCTEAALFPGAAPIGLIDGDKLLEVLVEHEIGIQKRPATFYELDEGCFEAPTEGELVEDAMAPEDIAGSTYFLSAGIFPWSAAGSNSRRWTSPCSVG
jgi:restriction system protein